MSVLVVGVDPGLTTGIFAATYAGAGEYMLATNLIAVQVHGHHGVVPLVIALLDRDLNAEPLLAVEQFVVGPRASRSSSANAGKVTRALIGQLTALHATIALRPAATVKTWATDTRLEAAGLLASCAQMSHARDAARHNLYAAVHAGIVRDPLSPRSVAR